MTFATIAERDDTSILSMISRRNAFTGVLRESERETSLWPPTSQGASERKRIPGRTPSSGNARSIRSDSTWSGRGRPAGLPPVHQREGAANGTINWGPGVLGTMRRLANENGKLVRVPVIRKLREAEPRCGVFEE